MFERWWKVGPRKELTAAVVHYIAVAVCGINLVHTFLKLLIIKLNMHSWNWKWQKHAFRCQVYDIVNVCDIIENYIYIKLLSSFQIIFLAFFAYVPQSNFRVGPNVNIANILCLQRNFSIK